MRLTFQPYTGEETLTHDDDNEIEENKNEETHTHGVDVDDAKFNK